MTSRTPSSSPTIGDSEPLSESAVSKDLEQAWDDLHTATPAGWGTSARPSTTSSASKWALYAFDTTERVKIGKRSREWTAVAPTEEGVVREMARCLHEIREGRVPK